MRSKQVRIQDHKRGGRVVLAITAAQLEQLRHPEERLRRFKRAKRDPREPLVTKGLLDYIGFGADGAPAYRRTTHGDAILRILESYR